MKVFDKKWFEIHQAKLLFFLNTPIIKYWFRWVMRIKEKGVINKILPNSVSYRAKYIDKETIEVITDFRTTNQYAETLYKAFKPIWWTMHFFDWLFIDKTIPQYSFGFSTLTANPASGTGGTTSVGITRRNADDADWATKIAGAGTAVQTPLVQGQIMSIVSGSVSGHWQILRRGFFSFDTSALTSAASISAAVLSINGTDKLDDLGITPNIDIYTATPGDPGTIVASDFTQLGSTSQTGSPVTYSGWSTTGYNAFTFNATGIGNVSKTGISKFGTRNANYDVAASAPTWGNTLTSHFTGSGSDDAGNEPKLVVTYTIVTSNIKTINTNVLANVKTLDTNAIANVKTYNTNTNT